MGIQGKKGLLPQVVEGLDLGVAEGAVVDAQVVEGSVQVIVGVGDRLALASPAPALRRMDGNDLGVQLATSLWK